MRRSWTGGGISVSLDDRVVSWKPHPSHLVSDCPRERSTVSPIPFLNALRENVRSEVCLEGLVGIDLPSIYEGCVVTHVLAD